MRFQWLCDLPPIKATAPVPDPPSDVLGDLLSASGAGGGDTEAAWRRDENPRGAHVADRVAQTVVAMQLESKVGADLPPDSYGYRPGRSALDAVAACRQRCWKTDWVIDLDIQKFFDSVPHGISCSRRWRPHTDLPWVLLYVQAVAASAGAAARRDPAAARPGHPARVPGLAGAGQPVPALCVRRVDGAGVSRASGSNAMPMTRSCTASPSAKPDRCVAAIEDRMDEVGLRLHPDKTKIVYCQGREPPTRLRAHGVYVPGVHFSRPCSAHAARNVFVAFQPAISKDAQNKISGQIRRWRLHR